MYLWVDWNIPQRSASHDALHILKYTPIEIYPNWNIPQLKYTPIEIYPNWNIPQIYPNAVPYMRARCSACVYVYLCICMYVWDEMIKVYSHVPHGLVCSSLCMYVSVCIYMHLHHIHICVCTHTHTLIHAHTRAGAQELKNHTHTHTHIDTYTYTCRCPGAKEKYPEVGWALV